MQHSPKAFLKVTLAAGCLTTTAAYSQGKQSAVVLFEKMHIFDGKGSALSAASNVLVSGNKIANFTRRDSGRSPC